jgi:hypothetical protein
MAVVDDIKIPGALSAVAALVKQNLANEMWAWYRDHENDTITTVKVWFINVKIHVHDIRVLFVILFGEPLRS